MGNATARHERRVWHGREEQTACGKWLRGANRMPDTAVDREPHARRLLYGVNRIQNGVAERELHAKHLLRSANLMRDRLQGSSCLRGTVPGSGPQLQGENNVWDTTARR